jgi:hypothetical protein
MRRRDLLSGLLLLGGGRILSEAAPIGNLSAFFSPGPLCRPDGPGMQICEGRSCVFMAAVASRAQENSKWCWAACLEMAFTCFDHHVSQEAIVKSTWGDIRNAPASVDMLVATLNREYVGARGERFHPQAQLIDRTTTVFSDMASLGRTFDHVAAGKPAIVASFTPRGTGHATMLIGLTVRRSADGKSLPEFRSARVYDPWPDEKGRSQSRDFTLGDWNRSPFILLIDFPATKGEQP